MWPWGNVLLLTAGCQPGHLLSHIARYDAPTDKKGHYGSQKKSPKRATPKKDGQCRPCLSSKVQKDFKLGRAMNSKEKARKVQRGLRVNPKSEKAAGGPYCAQFELLQVFVIYLDSK